MPRALVAAAAGAGIARAAKQTGRNAQAARILGLAQLAGGVLLLAVPDQVARSVAGDATIEVPPWIVRVLGARMATQGGVEAGFPTKPVTIGSTVVDVLHALSMGGLALAVPRYRRVGVIAALPAAVAAVRGVQIARGAGSA